MDRLVSTHILKNIELFTIIIQLIIVLYTYTKYLIVKKYKGNGSLVLTSKNIKILSVSIILLNLILGVCHFIRVTM